MGKLIPNLLERLCRPAVLTMSLMGGFLASIPENVSAQGCYALRLAANNKYLTDTGPLRMQAANNQDNQVFKLEPVGDYVRITLQGGSGAGYHTFTRRSNNAVDANFLYRGADEQLWKKKWIENNGTDNLYGFVQKNTTEGFGSTYNWGDGDPNSWSDINMVPESDLNIYGANKWILVPKTCPLSSGTCDFNVTLASSNLSPQSNTNFTLTAACTGSGCSSVSYRWAAQGSESGIYGNPMTLNIATPGPIDYTVIAAKTGCMTRTAHVRVNIQASGGRTGVSEPLAQNETSRELRVFPNPGKGEFEVDFYLEKGEPADITVTSVAGETIQKKSVVGKGLHREKFDLSSKTPGMYLFNVIKRNQIEVKKILVNK
ncbi:T9SS type A sorting domain-containing protein [Dyadobacter endophyticus]|uniref:T9SS type A sorting domain-containing protein n=1 Tax=Dyadobacter TaxID=120831 RepID=UPI003CF9A0B3